MAIKNKYSSSVANIPKKRWRGKMLLIIVIIAVAAVGSVAWAVHRHRVANNAAKANNARITQGQKNGKSTSSSQQASGSTQPPATQTNKNPGSSQQQTGGPAPESPGTYSTFVSSHTLAMNDRAATTCVTTAGASCTVEFAQGSTTKSLPAQTTDSTGSAYFYWTPAQAGLSPGNWTVILKASLNGATKTVQDNEPLQVT